MAAKCPFCGSTIETEGVEKGESVSCPKCNAEIDSSMLNDDVEVPEEALEMPPIPDEALEEEPPKGPVD